jgi:hypothetical protein
VGKKLRLPLMSFPQLRETSYIDEILPEIIHIALLLQRFGYRRGIQLCEHLFAAINEISSATALPFASALTIDEQLHSTLTERLTAEGVLQELRSAFAPMQLFLDWPLGYLGFDDLEHELAVSQIKDCVGKILDKSETPACAALATVIYWYRAIGKLKYTNGIKPPDLNAIIEAPDSEAAAIARAHVRASVMAFWAMQVTEDPLDPKWAPSSWVQCFRLEGCHVNDQGHN